MGGGKGSGRGGGEASVVVGNCHELLVMELQSRRLLALDVHHSQLVPPLGVSYVC